MNPHPKMLKECYGLVGAMVNAYNKLQKVFKQQYLRRFKKG